VAMCRWTQTSHENIGNQRTLKCGFDENGTPQLEYHNRYVLLFVDRVTVVYVSLRWLVV